MKFDMRILLRDLNEDVVAAWEKEFTLKPLPKDFEVDIAQGNILEVSCNAIVSPANSFGFMDGGIDLAYTLFFGRELQKRLQDNIRIDCGDELLVGDSMVLSTFNKQIPHLISAPTMRTPRNLINTINVYLATRAACQDALRWVFSSVAFPGMGTGVGNLPPEVAAVQMRRGFLDAYQGMKPVSSLFERALEEKNLSAGNDVDAMTYIRESKNEVSETS